MYENQIESVRTLVCAGNVLNPQFLYAMRGENWHENIRAASAALFLSCKSNEMRIYLISLLLHKIRDII